MRRYLLIGVIFFSFSKMYFSQKIEIASTGNNSFKSILSDSYEFKSVENLGYFNFGLTDEIWLIRFSSIPSSQLVFSINNPTIDTVKYFGKFRGNIFALEQLDLGYSRILRNDFGYDTVIVACKSTTPLFIPYSLQGMQSIRAENNELENFFFVFLGILITVLLYNLFIYLTSRDKIYLLYFFFILVIGVTQYVLFGQSHYFGLNHAFKNLSLVQLVGVLSGIVTIIFSREFLRLKVYSKWIYQITNLSIFTYVIAFIFIFIGRSNWSYQLINVNASLSILLVYGGVRAFRSGYRPALYFILAFSSFLIGVTIFAIKDFGILGFNSFTKYSLPTGVIIEAILLSLALADRINILKKEKEASQSQAILMMQENQRLVNEQNTLLEKQVEERTKELTRSNIHLEQTLSNLQLTQKQLIESEKLASLGQMTAGIAHEINNPVNFVRSNVQPLKRDIDEMLSVINEVNPTLQVEDLNQHWLLLQKKYKDLDVDYLKQEILQLLNGIDEGSRRTADIVKSLRVFSRMDHDALVSADINECIQSTLMVMKNVTSKECLVNLHLDQQLPPILCYAGKLNQVFMNLVSNAIHATRMEGRSIEDRKIDIYTSQSNNEIIIKIQDNGTGMTDEVRKKIFDPFFTTKQVGEGTGLGLSIVMGIVQEHGGKIDIDSEWNKGTIFQITLPKNNPSIS
jgi:two-component system, NtrC family, sensor kinase